MVRHYFDYAAGTPLDSRVEKAMKPFWSGVYGNPGAIHLFGQEASAAVFKARDTIAKALGCNYREIIFTGSATEANNLALRGIAQSAKRKAISDLRLAISKPKIIVSAIEHDSILETARDLERDGIEVVYLPVSKEGIVDLKRLKKELDERTVLVSVMYVNNEVGAIQPIAEISKIIRNFREQSAKRKAQSDSRFAISAMPLFHTDAVQAFNYLNCNVNDLGVDLMTLSAQKIYGPKGAGALYARRIAKRESQSATKGRFALSDLPLAPIITGGSQQEYGLRGGTENVPAIVGFGKAVELVEKSRNSESKRLRRLQGHFLAKLKKIFPKAQLNGPLIGENRIPNNLDFYFPGQSGQDLIIKLDLAGFAVSPGAACTARVCQPSHVLKSMGFSDERAAGSLRFTFGRPTTKTEINKLLGVIAKIFAGVL